MLGVSPSACLTHSGRSCCHEIFADLRMMQHPAHRDKMLMAKEGVEGFDRRKGLRSEDVGLSGCNENSSFSSYEQNWSTKQFGATDPVACLRKGTQLTFMSVCPRDSNILSGSKADKAGAPQWSALLRKCQEGRFDPIYHLHLS